MRPRTNNHLRQRVHKIWYTNVGGDKYIISTSARAVYASCNLWAKAKGLQESRLIIRGDQARDFVAFSEDYTHIRHLIYSRTGVPVISVLIKLHYPICNLLFFNTIALKVFPFSFRHYYKRGILERVEGRRLVYKFSRIAMERVREKRYSVWVWTVYNNSETHAKYPNVCFVSP